MNYWYSARPNEIFLDLDSNRAISRALSVLRVALRKRKLPVEQVWLHATPTDGHAHLIVQLKTDLKWQTRLAWSMWMGNDRLRAAYILERQANSFLKNHDLLVSNRMYYRPPDAFCECRDKHKEKKVTHRCPAMLHLLGEYRSEDYFARTGSAPAKKKIRVPWGRVPLSKIRQWSDA